MDAARCLFLFFIRAKDFEFKERGACRAAMSAAAGGGKREQEPAQRSAIRMAVSSANDRAGYRKRICSATLSPFALASREPRHAFLRSEPF